MDEEALVDQLIQIIEDIIASGEAVDDSLVYEITQTISDILTDIHQENQEIEKKQPVNAPISESADLLWILAGGQPNAFASYLREFPDPELKYLANNPKLLASTIQQLQRSNPITRNAQADGIQQAPLQSSNVYGFRFDPKSKKLQVRFQGGSLYEYDDVPDVIFNLFSKGNASARTNGRNRFGSWWKNKNPSLGASLNQYIKAGGYNYRKIR